MSTKVKSEKMGFCFFFVLFFYMSKKVCVFSSPRYWHMLYYYCRLPITVAISVPHSAIQCNTLCLSAGFTRRRVFITPRQNMTFVAVLLKTFAVRRSKNNSTTVAVDISCQRETAVTFSKTFYVPLTCLTPPLDTCQRAEKQTIVYHWEVHSLVVCTDLII